MKQQINRVMLVGTNSGCGKTTVTCGILRALQQRGEQVRSFKCGPDYIDPMFHSKVLGLHSRNIDLFLCDTPTAKSLFAKNCVPDGIAVAEGVMGYYDGMGGNSAQNSSYDIANQFGIPTVLVVDGKGASLSVVATIQGFLQFRQPNNLKGVILNRVSPMMKEYYREMIESQTGLKLLGCLPMAPEATIESRHLGLVTAEEIEGLQEKMDTLGQLVEKHLDLDGLLALSKSAPEFEYEPQQETPICSVNLAVARDKAFCFYYQDGLEYLQQLGAKLHYFSPLDDQSLPEGMDGLLLGGGYPELVLEQLSNNQSMKDSITKAIGAGMPTVAECGGFMYLGERIEGYPMCGVLKMDSEMTNRLQHFGYVNLTPLTENGWMQQSIPAHEFHYSKSNLQPLSCRAEKLTGKSWESHYIADNLFAGYPHLHFCGAKTIAKQFLTRCEEWNHESSH